MAGKRTLKSIKDWPVTAMPGDRIRYHTEGQLRNEELFQQFSDLSDQGKVMLYQKRSHIRGRILWEWWAQRTSQRAARFLAHVSKSVKWQYTPGWTAGG